MQCRVIELGDPEVERNMQGRQLELHSPGEALSFEFLRGQCKVGSEETSTACCDEGTIAVSSPGKVSTCCSEKKALFS